MLKTEKREGRAFGLIKAESKISSWIQKCECINWTGDSKTTMSHEELRFEDNFEHLEILIDPRYQINEADFLDKV